MAASSCGVMANADEAGSFAADTVVDEVAAENDLFTQWAGASAFINREYSTDDVTMYDVVDARGNGKGYYLVDASGKLLSYSLNEEPDEFALDYISSYRAGNSDDAAPYAPTRYSNYNVLGGLSPQLQGTSNCIVAAASNVMWYYSHNGYSFLTGTNTWATVKSMMAYCYSSAGGNTNNNSPTAISQYVYINGPTHSVSVSVNWYPDVDLLLDEIDAGRPMMLGYAAGSPFSQTLGHMTMACGYQWMNYNWYAYVVTGYSTGPSFYVWDDNINDCIITVKMNYYKNEAGMNR